MWRGLVGWAVYWLVAALILLEVVLQVAAVIAQRQAPGVVATALPTGTVRILCIGDSNTYGLYLERDEAYPAQLEALWNQRARGPRAEVLNLGLPGTNSSRVVRDFARLLRVFEPDVVVAMVGANDFWTVPFPLDDAEAAESPGFLRRHSRVYRLLLLIVRGLDARELDVVSKREGPVPTPPTQSKPRVPDEGTYAVRYGDEDFDMSFLRARPGLAGDRDALERNLETLVRRAEEHDVQLVLMTYPSNRPFYRLANDALREVAARTDATLIDLNERFESACPTPGCSALLFEDGHPKQRGYRLVAEAVVEALVGGTDR